MQKLRISRRQFKEFLQNRPDVPYDMYHVHHCLGAQLLRSRYPKAPMICWGTLSGHVRKKHEDDSTTITVPVWLKHFFNELFRAGTNRKPRYPSRMTGAQILKIFVKMDGTNAAS